MSEFKLDDAIQELRSEMREFEINKDNFDAVLVRIWENHFIRSAHYIGELTLEMVRLQSQTELSGAESYQTDAQANS